MSRRMWLAVLASSLLMPVFGCGEEQSADYNMTPVEQEQMIEDDIETQRALTGG